MKIPAVFSVTIMIGSALFPSACTPRSENVSEEWRNRQYGPNEMHHRGVFVQRKVLRGLNASVARSEATRFVERLPSGVRLAFLYLTSDQGDLERYAPSLFGETPGIVDYERRVNNLRMSARRSSPSVSGPLAKVIAIGQSGLLSLRFAGTIDGTSGKGPSAQNGDAVVEVPIGSGEDPSNFAIGSRRYRMLASDYEVLNAGSASEERLVGAFWTAEDAVSCSDCLELAQRLGGIAGEMRVSIVIRRDLWSDHAAVPLVNPFLPGSAYVFPDSELLPPTARRFYSAFEMSCRRGETHCWTNPGASQWGSAETWRRPNSP